MLSSGSRVLWFTHGNFDFQLFIVCTVVLLCEFGFPVEQTMLYVDSGVYAHLVGVGGKVSRRTP